MANKKNNDDVKGLQAPKMSVQEREQLKAEKAKQREKDAKKATREKRPNIFRRIWGGLRNIWGELKKVRWPSFGHAVAQTGVVLSVVLIFGLLILGIDFGLGALHGLLTRGL